MTMFSEVRCTIPYFQSICGVYITNFLGTIKGAAR